MVRFDNSLEGLIGLTGSKCTQAHGLLQGKKKLKSANNTLDRAWESAKCEASVVLRVRFTSSPDVWQ